MIVRSVISVIICQCFLAVALLADPGRELQALIDAVPEGGTLTLEDGVYHGTFRVQRPMTIRAANPGKVTLTNAHPHPLEFRADERAPGLYVAEVQHRVRWVMVGSRNLYNYVTLDDLVTFTARPAHTRLREPASGLFEEGFAWEDGQLFVRLLDHADIRRERVRVNSDRMDGWSYFLKDNGTTATQSYVRPATQPVMLHYEGQPDRELLLPDDLGVIVSIESDRVTLEGLRIELAPDVGVDVKWGRDVVIRDCYFEGFQYGINTGERCIGLTVEHCEFSGGRLYTRYRALQQAGSGKRWQAIYFSGLEINVIAQKGPGFIFRHNFIYEAFDGVQARGVHPDVVAELPDLPSDLSYNVIMNCIDNNLELDAWDRRANTRVHHNLVVNGSSLLSCAPIQGGPLMVDHNIFFNAPENGLHGGYLLKHNQPASPQKLNTGLTVVHNTFVTPYKLLWTDEWFPPEYASNTIENNIMLVDTSAAWQRDGFTPTAHNLLWGKNTDASHIAGAVHADPGFASTEPYDFHLSPQSPAIDAGVNRDAEYHHNSVGGTDLGAIEFGTRWSMPKPGPRWGNRDTLPGRPGFPPSLPVHWAGFTLEDVGVLEILP